MMVGVFTRRAGPLSVGTLARGRRPHAPDLLWEIQVSGGLQPHHASALWGGQVQIGEDSLTQRGFANCIVTAVTGQGLPRTPRIHSGVAPRGPPSARGQPKSSLPSPLGLEARGGVPR